MPVVHKRKNSDEATKVVERIHIFFLKLKERSVRVFKSSFLGCEQILKVDFDVKFRNFPELNFAKILT